MIRTNVYPQMTWRNLQITYEYLLTKQNKKQKERENREKRGGGLPSCWSISVVSLGHVSITFTNACNPGCSISLSRIYNQLKTMREIEERGKVEAEIEKKGHGKSGRIPSRLMDFNSAQTRAASAMAIAPSESILLPKINVSECTGRIVIQKQKMK